MNNFTIRLIERNTSNEVRRFSYYNEEVMLDELCTMLHLIDDGKHMLLVKFDMPDYFTITAIPELYMEGSYLSVYIESSSSSDIHKFIIDKDDIFHAGSEMVDELEYVVSKAREMSNIVCNDLCY